MPSKKKASQKWIVDEESAAQYEREAAFFEAVAPFLSQYEEHRDKAREQASTEEEGYRYISSGNIARDALGGEIFYVYLFPPENKIRLGAGFKKKDVAEVGDVFPSVRTEYLNRMPSVIKEALSKELYKLLGLSLSERAHGGMLGRFHFKPLSWFPPEVVTIEYKSEEGTVEVRRFPRKRRPRKTKLPPAEQAALLHRFEELQTLCANIKSSHDKQHKEYQDSPKVQSRGYDSDTWVLEWIRREQQLYEYPESFLRQFAEPSGRGFRTASEVAYEALSGETGYTVSYLEKLLTRQRKENGQT
jgi:hypothetical protein